MDSIGYIPFDVSELHKPENILIQIDIVFIRKVTISTEDVDFTT